MASYDVDQRKKTNYSESFTNLQYEMCIKQTNTHVKDRLFDFFFTIVFSYFQKPTRFNTYEEETVFFMILKHCRKGV
jgi:hypothetical protein